jgi:hypothetical protein
MNETIQAMNETEPSSKLILPYYSKEVDAVHESIQNAINLIQYYSEEQDNITMSSSTTTTTPSTTTTTKTTNPDEIYQQLDTARNQISDACQTLYDVIHSKDDHHDNDDMSKNQEQQQQNPLTEQEQIRIAYLNMITDSFGNVLEQFHTAATVSNDDTTSATSSHYDIDVLADCLQSGYDMLTLLNSSSSRVWYDNDFLWNDNEGDDDGNNDDDDEDDDEQYITPHERHRQELGFQLPVVN